MPEAGLGLEPPQMLAGRTEGRLLGRVTLFRAHDGQHGRAKPANVFVARFNLPPEQPRFAPLFHCRRRRGQANALRRRTGTPSRSLSQLKRTWDPCPRDDVRHRHAHRGHAGS
jgi:hypothetical protein